LKAEPNGADFLAGRTDPDPELREGVPDRARDLLLVESGRQLLDGREDAVAHLLVGGFGGV
jgi:hypothetical protein